MEQILKWVGGKQRISKWIISFFPKHRIYVEVFGGSGIVLANKPPSEIEVYNDINGDLVNFFTVIRERTEEFIKAFEFLPYSREIFERFFKEWQKGIKGKDNLERAVRFFYLSNASFSGTFHSFSTTTTRNVAREFNNKLEKVREFAKRFKNVIIENLDFEEVIKKYDTEETLFYCDPPYALEEKNDYYQGTKPWGRSQHVRFARVINNIKGKAIISYYDHPIIKEFYSNWHIERLKIKKTMDFKSEEERNVAEELLLMNFKPKKSISEYIDSNQHINQNI